MSESAGLYVHLPFCTRKCPYCDFNTWPLDQMADAGAPARFWPALQAEVAWLLASLELEDHPPNIETLYFGGGTPSLSDPEEIAALIAQVRDYGHRLREITLEANPESFSQDRFGGFLRAGVTRMSVGVQSFTDAVLQALGREHGAGDARRVLAWIGKQPGLVSWNFDLIYGVAGQTMGAFDRELDELLQWSPPHVSLYALEIHRGTELGRRAQAGARPAASDDEQAALFDLAREKLLSSGYRHYEIANFARTGQEAMHNSAYWRRRPVLAAGPGATGLWRGRDAPWGIRWKVPASLEGYIQWTGSMNSDSPAPLGEALARLSPRAESLSAEQALAESFFLGLRLLEEGVDLEEATKEFGPQAVGRKMAALAPHIGRGWVFHEGGRVRLAGERAMVANAVLADLIGEAPMGRPDSAIAQ